MAGGFSVPMARGGGGRIPRPLFPGSGRQLDPRLGRRQMHPVPGKLLPLRQGKRTAPSGGIPGLPGATEKDQKDGGSHQAVAEVGQPFQSSQRRTSPAGLQHGKGAQADGDAGAAGFGAEKNRPELRQPRAERGDRVPARKYLQGLRPGTGLEGGKSGGEIRRAGGGGGKKRGGEIHPSPPPDG